MQNVNLVLNTVAIVFISFLAGVEFTNHHPVWMAVDLVLAAVNLHLLISGIKMRTTYEVLYGIREDIKNKVEEQENGKQTLS